MRTGRTGSPKKDLSAALGHPEDYVNRGGAETLEGIGDGGDEAKDREGDRRDMEIKAISATLGHPEHYVSRGDAETVEVVGDRGGEVIDRSHMEEGVAGEEDRVSSTLRKGKVWVRGEKLERSFCWRQDWRRGWLATTTWPQTGVG